MIYLKKTFEVKDNIAFDPSKSDISCKEKNYMTEAVLNVLRKITDISNSSLVKNADGLLSKKPAKMGVEWIGKSKNRLPSNKYKLSY